MVDYVSIQKHIVENVSENYRMIMFKRSIFRLASKIAKIIKAKAIVS
jgi:adenylyl- and sulfurtransferase ThiI